MKFNRKHLGAAALSLVLASAPVHGTVHAETASPESTGKAENGSVQLPSIYVHTVANKMVRVSVFGSGFIHPVDEVYVQPEVQGVAIEDVLVEAGDTVAAGQVMAKLKQDQLLLEKSRLTASLARTEASVAQLEAAVAEAEANAIAPRDTFTRSEKLFRKRTISEAQYDQAKAAAEAAEARIKSANANLQASRLDVEVSKSQLADIELRLRRTGVKAPVSGLVSAKNARIGALAAAAGEPLFTIIRDGKLELRLDISEEELIKVKEGMQASIALSGSSKMLDGTVRLVDPVIDLQSRLGKVRLAIDEDERVRAGMFAEANILIREKETIAIPLPALSIEDGQASVLRVSDGVVSRVIVETGFQHNGEVEITNGLSAGDVIVAKAGAFVRDGDRINPVFETGPEANLKSTLN